MRGKWDENCRAWWSMGKSCALSILASSALSRFVHIPRKYALWRPLSKDAQIDVILVVHSWLCQAKVNNAARTLTICLAISIASFFVLCVPANIGHLFGSPIDDWEPHAAGTDSISRNDRSNCPANNTIWLLFPFNSLAVYLACEWRS